MEVQNVIINNLVSLELEKLLELWESTTEEKINVQLATMRGLLMDAIETKNPSGFKAWLENVVSLDKELRSYVLYK